MNTRSFSALLTAALGCLLLVSSCAKPTTGDPSGTAGTGGSCSAGQMSCNGQCKTLASDNANCGSCGNACGSGRSCQNGTCTCATGLFLCSGSCVSSDAQHCGGCNACPTGQVCSNNACLASCPSGQTMCSGGACIPASGDNTIAHCGGCNACPAGATACNNGSCGCTGTDMLCGSSCVNTNTSNTHCGGCNQPCTNGQCTNGTCVASTGSAGTSGTAGTTGAGGRGGTSGSAGTIGTAGTTGNAGRGGTTGSAGTTGAGGSGGSGGTPPGWWTSGSMHGCPWTGIDVLNVGTTNTPQDFTTKTDSFATPYCVSGTVGPDPGYNGVALLGFNLNETSTGTANQCAYKPADGTAIGPPAVTVTGTGIAVAFTKTVGSVLRIQIQDEMGGLTTGGDTHRWCYTITDVQGPVFAPWNKFNTKCWDQTGTNFNPSTNKVSAVVFGVPGNTIKTPFGYCIGGFAFGGDVSAAPAYNPNPWPTVAGTLGGPGTTDLDFQRVKVAAPGKGGKQYIVQNNNWGTPSGSDQTIMYSGNTFTIMSTTGNVTGAGVPASFPSIYVGNNGDTQSKNDPPKGSYTTKPADNLPKSISSIGTAMTTAAYNKNGGDFNATYDIWLASSAPTSAYSDALDGFVMVWLYKPGSRSPIGSMKASKAIGGSMYDVWAGPRNSGTNPNRPVVSYVLQGGSMNKTFDLKPILADAAANATTYGVGAISTSWLVTDIFFGFEIWTGSAASGLGVTNFSVDVQ